MAFSGKKIENKLNGQQIEFVRTAIDSHRSMLEIIVTFNGNSLEPIPHAHPFQDEYYEVLEGEFTLKVKDQIRVFHAGEQIEIRRKKVHAAWNNSDGKTVVRWTVKPALKTEEFIENITGLANDGKLNKFGMPVLLQRAIFAEAYANEIVWKKPAPNFQKFIYAILRPFAYLFGHRSSYAEYTENNY